jgi:hypothetical protein
MRREQSFFGDADANANVYKQATTSLFEAHFPHGSGYLSSCLFTVQVFNFRR